MNVFETANGTESSHEDEAEDDIEVFWSREIIDKASIINIFDRLAKTTIVEIDQDHDSNKMLILFDSILYY